jgi:5'-nucleotidase
MRSPLLLLALLAFVDCAMGPHPRNRPAQAEPVQLTIVGTNDLHGWVQPHEARLSNGTEVRSGGLAVFASEVARLREVNPGGVVLVDAGDLFQGTLVANLTEGAVVIAAYNALGYDAAAIGNHEFDYGPLGPRSIALEPGDDPLGALAARAAQARFPLLGRNVYLASSGERLPFLAKGGLAIVERKGIKIGLLGLVTPTTPTVTNPLNVAGLRFTALTDEARKAAAELRAQGADVLVALVHASGSCALTDPHSLEGCDLRSEIFEMIGALPERTFDALVAGHTHGRLGHFVNGTALLESGSFGTHFGTIDLFVDPASRRVLADRTRIRAALPICAEVFEHTGDCDARRGEGAGELVPATFDGAPIAPDAKLEALLDPFLDTVAAEQRRSLGISVPRTLARDSRAESALGDAIADALREMEGADVALLNSGGFRADLRSGELTFGALYEVLPFDNAIATLQVTGAELVLMLEGLLSGKHGVPQTSGLRFEVESCPGRSRIGAIKLADGRPFDRAATYRLVTSDFLALGGDGLGPPMGAVPQNRKNLGRGRDQNMRDALAQYLERKARPLEGRVEGRMVLKPGAGCRR